MRDRLLAAGLTERTSPMSVTRPVNTLNSLEGFERIGAEPLRPARLQAFGQRAERHAFERVDAIGADGLFGAQQHHFVDETAADETRGNFRPALDHQACNA